jgi:hypothetical protein
MHEHAPVLVQVEDKRGWVRWVLLAAGIAFCLPVPFNLYRGDFANAAGGAVIGAAGVGGFLVTHRARIARANFIRWLYENADAVRNGSATFDGQPIRLSTRLRVFETAVSMLLVSCKFSSRFIVDGDPAATTVKFTSTAASLLLGWWGIPFGPVFTLMAVYRNLRGGHTTTVSQLLGQ